MLLLLPLTWTAHVQLLDLPSHTYNAWLASLIRQGELPGVSLHRGFTNRTFELTLDLLLGRLPFPAAERLAVAVTLLVLASGLVAWLKAVAGRFPWEISPLVLVACHGLPTQVGLMNFLWSVALGALAGAALLSGGGRRWLAAPLALLAAVSHPLGALMMLSLSGYLWVARRLSRRRQAWLFASGAGGLALVAVGLKLGLDTFRTLPPLAFLGASVLMPYRVEYLIPAVLYLFVLLSLLLGPGAHRESRTDWTGPQAQITALASIACLAFPTGIRFHPQPTDLTLIDHRMGLAVMVASLAWAGMRPLPRTAWVGSCTIAGFYFGLLFVDHRSFEQAQVTVQELVREVPPGARVVLPYRAEGYFFDPLARAVDRACTGFCFSYMNYEAASQHFRIRAAPMNGVVESDFSRISSFELGEIRIAPSDLPLYQLVAEGGCSRVRGSVPGERITKIPVKLPLPPPCRSGHP